MKLAGASVLIEVLRAPRPPAEGCLL